MSLRAEMHCSGTGSGIARVAKGKTGPVFTASVVQLSGEPCRAFKDLSMDARHSTPRGFLIRLQL